MERYSWIIIISVIGLLSLVGFFATIFHDMEYMKTHKRKKSTLLLNAGLLAISAGSIGLAIYLYFDVQTQIEFLNKLL